LIPLSGIPLSGVYCISNLCLRKMETLNVII
jgi:hypothetical protein